jgi:hypothetical protein
LEADSLPDLAAQRAALINKAQTYLGRPLTAREIEQGYAKPDPRPQSQIVADRAAKDAELNPVESKTPEQLIEDRALAALAADRLNKMSALERAAEEAVHNNNAAKARAAKEAEQAAFRATAAYNNIRQRLDELIFQAEFDPALTAAMRDDLQHQSAMLERYLDVAAVTANVSQLQRAATSAIDAERDKLKAQTDAVEYRRLAMGNGLVFDNVQLETVGEQTYVVLQSGDKTAKVTRERYDSRASDEALRAELWGAA